MRMLTSLALLCLAPTAMAVPLEFSHQGRLMDDTGAPLDGTEDVTFRIYDVDTGGTAVWTEVHTGLPFDSGYYAAQLGSTTTLDMADFDGNTMYMSVQVGTSPETSRIAMISVPYALRAGNVQDGAVINASEIQIGGVTVLDSTGYTGGGITDNDTLAGLGCAAGQMAEFDGAAWACVNHVHDAGEITTGIMDRARLPVGTGSTDVAAGNHSHSAFATGISIGDTGGTCDSGAAGSIRWDGTIFEACDGSGNWQGIKLDSGLDGQTALTASPSCDALHTYNLALPDGAYWLDPDGVGVGAGSFRAWCDMTTDGGGWTRLQLTDTNDELGMFFADTSACSYALATINGWGHGAIMDNQPDPARGTCYSIAEEGTTETFVWPLAYYDWDGNPIDPVQMVAMGAVVQSTVYDGWYYHNDMDSPCGTDGVGAYGGPDDTANADGGGGFVLFPAKGVDPSTDSDFVICDADNPHLTTGGATDREQLVWEPIANGLVTHMGVQDRSDAETTVIDWGAKDVGGGARSVLDSTWFYVR